MFKNLTVGPAICSDKPLMIRQIKKDIELENLIVVAIITDKTNPIFKMFDNQQVQANVVFITMQYIKPYE